MDDAKLQIRLGEAIRAQRHHLGITQEELAWRADLHRTYIANIERGGRNITLRSIANLAKALQVSVDTLLSLGADADGPRLPKTPRRAMGQVLLVEDSASDVELTLRAFRHAKFANPVKVLPDGEKALAYLLGTGRYSKRRGALLPQLVLLDLGLPGISGLEVLRQLKDDTRTRDIPVVVLTGSQHDRNILECSRLGASNYIIKPVNFDTFSRAAAQLNQRWALLKPGDQPMADAETDR